MNQRQRTPIMIGPREITIAVIVLAIVALGGLLFAFGLSRLNGGGTAETEPTATIEIASQSAAPTAAPVSAGTPTPVLGPTTTPLPTEVEHVVQEGETLISIALTYGVDLQDVLKANSLTLESMLQVGQTIIVPLPPEIAQSVMHVVQEGETLISIAAIYGVTPEVIQAANGLADTNAIYVGQQLRIPGAQPTTAPDAPPIDTPTAAEADPALGITTPNNEPAGPVQSDWERSIFEGDLDANYPLTYEHSRFTLHYQPGTLVEQQLDTVVSLVERALAQVEQTLGVRLDGTFDVYAAGTLFAAPNAHLRGLSQSFHRRSFFLYDGSGSPADNEYLVSHELTHLVSWNTWGAPSSTMLSEGLATYVGQPVLEEAGFLSYDQLCLGAYAAGVMSSMASIEQDFTSFQGHIRHRFNYFGSACFVEYLIEQYGRPTMSGLYHTSDYINLYGKTLTELDAEWQATLAARQGELTTDPTLLVDYTDEVTQAYAYVFGNYNGSATMHNAYAAVDRARVALWRGDYDSVRAYLDQVYDLTGFRP